MSPSRRLTAVTWQVAMLLASACAATEAESVPDAAADFADTTLGPIDPLDIRLEHSPRPRDVDDTDILYPGYPCDADMACSTGLCYGRATPQGAFEPARCQLVCLALNDFSAYCDSDADCCSGRCCLGCGPKRGLCTLALPAGPPSEY